LALAHFKPMAWQAAADPSLQAATSFTFPLRARRGVEGFVPLQWLVVPSPTKSSTRVVFRMAFPTYGFHSGTLSRSDPVCGPGLYWRIITDVIQRDTYPRVGRYPWGRVALACALVVLWTSCPRTARPGDPVDPKALLEAAQKADRVGRLARAERLWVKVLRGARGRGEDALRFRAALALSRVTLSRGRPQG